MKSLQKCVCSSSAPMCLGLIFAGLVRCIRLALCGLYALALAVIIILASSDLDSALERGNWRAAEIILWLFGVFLELRVSASVLLLAV